MLSQLHHISWKQQYLDDERSMGSYRKHTGRGKMTYFENNLSQCHFVHYKFQKDFTGSNMGIRGGRRAVKYLSHCISHNQNRAEMQ
jgi:hypothetical protein